MTDAEKLQLADARDHLGAALIQSIPSDDQMIIGHVRDAHGILETLLRRMTREGTGS